jgi:hypothetical protein
MPSELLVSKYLRLFQFLASVSISLYPQLRDENLTKEALKLYTFNIISSLLLVFSYLTVFIPCHKGNALYTKSQFSRLY